jgi:hypothetical protein
MILPGSDLMIGFRASGMHHKANMKRTRSAPFAKGKKTTYKLTVSQKKKRDIT